MHKCCVMMRDANPFPASPSGTGTHRMGERDVYLVIALPCPQVLMPGVFPSDEAWVNLSLHSCMESCLKCTYKHLAQAQRCERQVCHRQHVPHVHVHGHNCTHHPKSEHIASSQGPHGTFFPKNEIILSLEWPARPMPASGSPVSAFQGCHITPDC